MFRLQYVKLSCEEISAFNTIINLIKKYDCIKYFQISESSIFYERESGLINSLSKKKKKLLVEIEVINENVGNDEVEKVYNENNKRKIDASDKCNISYKRNKTNKNSEGEEIEKNGVEKEIYVDAEEVSNNVEHTENSNELRKNVIENSNDVIVDVDIEEVSNNVEHTGNSNELRKNVIENSNDVCVDVDVGEITNNLDNVIFNNNFMDIDTVLVIINSHDYQLYNQQSVSDCVVLLNNLQIVNHNGNSIYQLDNESISFDYDSSFFVTNENEPITVDPTLIINNPILTETNPTNPAKLKKLQKLAESILTFNNADYRFNIEGNKNETLLFNIFENCINFEIKLGADNCELLKYYFKAEAYLNELFNIVQKELSENLAKS
ncbi:hypothetical protein RclHR1_03450014 [Rhizophagus clarus]|uniref:Uncharacterized protein n=1 Tax=Rhizophagus clarus TaxID=94130 RepID=A0A2Z6RQ54_9GLOM|nr:hypothetical protein RclHR1_03450014 [Rhizophagus clarus]